MGDTEPPHAGHELRAQEQLEQLWRTLSSGEPDEQEAIVIATESLIASDARLAEDMLIAGSQSTHRELRRWAAIAIADAAHVPPDTYLSVADRLLQDDDQEVRTQAIESLIYHDPRTDISWADIAPVVRRAL